MAPRRFLFLQGLPSPFFRRIGERLRAAGHAAWGVNFCAGDQLFWRGPGTVNYRGRRRDWAAFIGALLDARAVTDIVLVGEQRGYHREAIAAAQARGVRVTVSDFGYLRPDWITLERDGMSGASRFPREAGAIRALAAALPRAELAPRYTDSFARMALGDMAYHLVNFFLFWLFPHYRRPYRRDPPLLHYPAIGWRLLAARRRERAACALVAGWRAEAARYFVLPLQLENDFQILAYSPFAGLEDAIHLVLDSFRVHAAAGDRLLVKVHPLDPGMKNWPRRLRRWAATRGLAARVACIDGGPLDDILRASAGVVTVNSTAAIRALQLGRPVKVLGQAIFDVPGLSAPLPLDEFWRAPPAPDASLVEAFVDAVAGTLQVRGVFYGEPGLSAGVEQAAARLARVED